MDSPKNDPVGPEQQPAPGTAAPALKAIEAPAEAEAATEAARADAPETPLTPGQWLMQNGIYLAILVGGLVWLYREHGWSGLPSAFLTIFGIGFIIFIHELGHFLVAKWCDVHVITFSIGFGPAIPGCSFKRGETTYKVALLPLGGYVNMVGEGSDADEGEDYPRSFKNKSVWQRMAIISAGVIMNVIFGAIAFMFVYRAHGVDRTRAVVAGTVPGGVAWIADVQSGWRIDRIGPNSHPTFEALRGDVALSGQDEEILFSFFNPRTKTETALELSPRKGDGPTPVVGIVPPSRLQLLELAYQKGGYSKPAVRNSAAAAARAIRLKSGDAVLAASGADDPEKLTDLPREDWAGELARRLRVLAGKTIKLKVQRAGGGAEEITLKDEGFDWGDVILGSSATGQKDYDPFRLADLPPDPRVEDAPCRDYFELRRRLRLLAGKPLVLQVRRARSGEAVNVFVPPAYNARFGARMQMGKVTAVRKGSRAEEAGLRGSLTSEKPADTISGVQIANEGRRNVLILGDPPKNLRPGDSQKASVLDPVRLPSQLAEFASQHPGQKIVTITVVRQADNAKQDIGHTLKDVLWDESYDDNIEMPSVGGPMSIPQLGVAYQVNSFIVGIEDRSPAAQAMRVEEDGGVSARVPDALCNKDVITSVRFWERGGGKSDWSDWIDVAPKDQPEDRWAFIAGHLRQGGSQPVQFKVRRNTEVLKEPIEVVLEEDPSWPMAERGLHLMPDTVLVKAESFGEALGYGWHETKDFIGKIYLGLSRVLTGRVSSKSFEGPIGIVSTTFKLAQDDIPRLILFLGILSINLAVVNFLPIPLLDGGHMVFLIYEKVRGKPPSDGFRNIAAYIGLAMLLALMVYVFLLDLGIIRR